MENLIDTEKSEGLNSNQIKLIAIIAMTIDHLTWLFIPGCVHIWWVIALHMIGRITAPIMWFFIAEGFYYTHDKVKYATRLFIFAFISHFAYNFAGGIPFIPSNIFNQTSVMWSLAWSVLLMIVVTNEEKPLWIKILFIIFVCLVTFPSDWSCIAAMCPLFIYSHRGNFKKQAFDIFIWTFMYALVYFFFIDKVYAFMQLATTLCIPILYYYNGKRGKGKTMKWLFYIYYPAHLFIIGLLRVIFNLDSIFPGN